MWCHPGFCVGPLLFTLFATPLSSVIQSHNLEHHLYADDTQIYISLNIANLQRAQFFWARVVTRSLRFSRLVPLVKSLHRLPLCTIALFWRLVHLPIKPFHLRNQHIWIRCSLRQEILDSYDQPSLNYSGNNECWNPSYLGCRTNRVEFASCQH